MRGRLSIVIMAAAPMATAAVACEDNLEITTPPGTGAGTATAGNGGTGGSTASNGGGGGIAVGGGMPCADGEPCDDGAGICAGGVCCAPDKACASQCCASSDVCSFQECVTPGGECIDAEDCPPGWYCEYGLGEPSMGTGGGGGSCMGGAEPPTGKCLPKPPICGPNEDPGDPPTCLEECQYVPPAATFAPVLTYSWGGNIVPPYDTDIMMAPIVVQLDDDDCDGVVTERDIPEIVFSTFSGGAYNGAGVLHAISIVGGQVVDKWSLPGVIWPTKQLAGGNIDGLPGNEIVGCGSDGTVKAIDATGTVLWSSAAMTCLMPSIADLDQDGNVEVIAEGAILDGATGATEHTYSAQVASSLVVSDVTGDGQLDVVTGSQIFDAAGNLVVDTGLANTSSFYGTADWKSPWPAVADFDADGTAEIVVMHNQNHELSIWRYDAAQPSGFVVVRAPVDTNGSFPPSNCPPGSWGNTHGGGPPLIGDFNGDGTPDVALAGGVGYATFDGALLMDPMTPGPATLLWINSTTDCSSASTGSTVFDFNGDGVAEVIYSDELYLRVYDGPTGNVLFEQCNTTATLIENPVVADVDNDGHADIVAVSNGYARQCNDGIGDRQSGVHVFSDPNGGWVRTRRVWNEHAYHITNSGEDGSIPQLEAVNYLVPGLNNFRQNKQPGSEFAAPDATVTLAPDCGPDYGLVATVRNLGEASLPAGVVVGFYFGAPPNGTLIDALTTTHALYALESEKLVLPLSSPPPGVQEGTTPVYAVVDDTATPHPEWTECRTDNNQSPPISAACGTPQ
jgi:VCBS repeat protein